MGYPSAAGLAPELGLPDEVLGNRDTSTPEITWRKYSSPTNGNRPKLVINYTIPKVAFDFDSALGSTYAPSNMTAGQVVKLPITVTNNGSGWTFNHYVSGSTDYFDVGYRWLDAKGNLVTCPSGTCTQHLSADVATGATSSLFAPPSHLRPRRANTPCVSISCTS